MNRLWIIVLFAAFSLQSCMPTSYVVNTPQLTQVRAKGEKEIAYAYGGNKNALKFNWAPADNWITGVNMEYSFGYTGEVSLGRVFQLGQNGVLKTSLGYGYSYLKRENRVGEPPILYWNRANVDGIYQKLFSMISLGIELGRSEIGCFIRPNYVHYNRMLYRRTKSIYIDDFNQPQIVDEWNVRNLAGFIADAGLYVIRGGKKGKAVFFNLSLTETWMEAERRHVEPLQGPWGTPEITSTIDPYPFILGSNFSFGFLFPIRKKSSDGSSSD